MTSVVMFLFCGKLIRYRLKFYVKCRQGLKKICCGNSTSVLLTFLVVMWFLFFLYGVVVFRALPCPPPISLHGIHHYIFRYFDCVMYNLLAAMVFWYGKVW